MRNWFKTTMAAIAVVLMTGLSTSVFGVASFARQTGLDCTSCHSELGFPTLNSFGQAFKAGGYTTGADENFIGDGESLSIPKNLNFSGVIKFRYWNGTYGNTAGSTYEPATESILEIPDEAVLFIGGRVGKNIGWIVEAPPDGWAAFRMAFVIDLGGMKIGITPFLTDGHGPGWGFETLSTGNAKHLRAAENKTAVSAQAYNNWGHGSNGNAAHGIALYLWSPMFFVNYSAINSAPSAAFGGSGTQHGELYYHYMRAAFTPTFGGLEAGLGVTYSTGTDAGQSEDMIGEDTNGDETNSNGSFRRDMSYLAVDAQLQGNVGIPLGVYITYAANTGSDYYELNTAGRIGSPDADAFSSFNLFVEAGLIPGKLQLGLGYASYIDGNLGDVDEAAGYGTAELGIGSDFLAVAKYYITMNMRLNVEYTMGMTTGASALMVMLFGSF